MIADSVEADDYYQSEFMFVSRHGLWLPVELLLMWCLACENRVDPITWLLKRPMLIYLGGIGLNTYLLHFPMKNALEDWQTRVDPDEGWARKQTLNEGWCKSDKRVKTPHDFFDAIPSVAAMEMKRHTVHPNVYFAVYVAVLLSAAVAMHHFVEGPVRFGVCWCIPLFTSRYFVAGKKPRCNR